MEETQIYEESRFYFNLGLELEKEEEMMVERGCEVQMNFWLCFREL